MWGGNYYHNTLAVPARLAGWWDCWWGTRSSFGWSVSVGRTSGQTIGGIAGLTARGWSVGRVVWIAPAAAGTGYHVTSALWLSIRGTAFL